MSNYWWILIGVIVFVGLLMKWSFSQAKYQEEQKQKKLEEYNKKLAERRKHSSRKHAVK
jgi:hypothetical protein